MITPNSCGNASNFISVDLNVTCEECDAFAFVQLRGEPWRLRNGQCSQLTAMIFEDSRESIWNARASPTFYRTAGACRFLLRMLMRARLILAGSCRNADNDFRDQYPLSVSYALMRFRALTISRSALIAIAETRRRVLSYCHQGQKSPSRAPEILLQLKGHSCLRFYLKRPVARQAIVSTRSVRLTLVVGGSRLKPTGLRNSGAWNYANSFLWSRAG
jgi:hypothetical protein